MVYYQPTELRPCLMLALQHKSGNGGSMMRASEAKSITLLEELDRDGESEIMWRVGSEVRSVAVSMVSSQVRDIEEYARENGDMSPDEVTSIDQDAVLWLLTVSCVDIDPEDDLDVGVVTELPHSVSSRVDAIAVLCGVAELFGLLDATVIRHRVAFATQYPNTKWTEESFTDAPCSCPSCTKYRAEKN